ncbi:MAG: hypothetical protein U1A72_17005 [Sulfuritalea sp.]|nr:hypothetical protein [Sulfuritalea sp.]
MTPHNASTAARELVRSYIENQAGIHVAGMTTKETGELMADMLIAMHKKLADYFEKRE